jgi:outer membrane lipoprotein carrier protein
MKPRSPSLLVLLLLWLSPSLALAQPAQGIPQLRTFLDDLTSLRANFQQVTYTQDAAAGQSAAGVFYLQRPDHFRWNYTRPGQQEIVADGLSVWYYEPDLEQVSVQFQALALKGTPARILTSEEPIDTYFELEEGGEREGLAWVTLYSKEEEPRFQEIELGLEAGQLAAMRMLDNFGQTIWFLFEDLEKNPQLDSELFRFEPPPGYDILDQ